MKSSTFSVPARVGQGVLACLAFCAGPGVAVVRAQTSTWTGAVSNAWGTPGNWSKAPAFDGTDQLLLGNLVQPSQTLGGTRSIHTLTISQGGFTIAGDTLSLQAAGAGVYSTGNNTINSAILPFVDASSTVRSNAGTLTLGGVVYVVNANLATPSPVFDGSGNFAVTGSVMGGGALTMNGTGTLLLSGTSSVGGATTINGGTFKLAAANLLQNGLLIVNAGGTFDLNGLDVTLTHLNGTGTVLLGANTLTLNLSSYSQPSFSGTISGSGGLVITGSLDGVQTLGGKNTYQGGTTVRGGFLSYGDDGNLGAASGPLTLNGGGLKFAGNGTVTRPVVIGGSGATFSTNPGTTSSLPSLISGSGPVTYGYNTGGEGTWVASGNYTYTGVTSIVTGNLAITDNAQLGASGNAVTASGGSLLLRGGVTVAGRTITLSGYGNATNDSLGTLVSDTGDNAWTGPVAVSYAGKVGVAAGSTFTLSGPISGNTTLYLNSVGDTVISGTVGTTVSKGYGGTLTLPGNNAAYGLIVTGGTAVLAGGGAVTGAGGITLGNEGTLRLGANQTVGGVSDYGIAGATLDLGSHDLTLTTGGSFAGTITGAGRLFMQGKGTLTLSGQNNFTGGLYIDSGTLVANSDASFGAASNPVVFRGGTLQVYGDTLPSTSHPLTFSTPDVSLNVYSGTFTLGQTLTNTGGLTKLGAGTLVLTGTNSYAGGTVLSAGTLSVSSDASLGAGGGGLSLQGGTLQVTGNTFHSTTRPLTSGTAYSGFDVADPANTFTLGAITGSAGGIFKYGAGTLVLAGPTPLGTASANAGTLRLGASNVLTASSSISVATGATFDLAGFNQTAAYLGVSGALTTGAGTLSVSNGINGYAPGGLITGQLALTGNNVTVYSNYNGTGSGGLTIAAAVSGNHTLTMQGTGALILAGDNPFAGTTVVNAGTLRLTGSLLHTVGVTVAQGALLEVADGHLGVSGNVTNNGFLRLTGAATLAASGAITNNGVLDISGWRGVLPANFINGKGGVVLDATGLQITQTARSAAAVQVTVNGLVGLSYQLQRATSLTLADWQVAGSSGVPQAATVNGPLVLTDSYPLTTSPGFYRVVVSQAAGSSGK